MLQSWCGTFLLFEIQLRPGHCYFQGKHGYQGSEGRTLINIWSNRPRIFLNIANSYGRWPWKSDWHLVSCKMTCYYYSQSAFCTQSDVSSLHFVLIAYIFYSRVPVDWRRTSGAPDFIPILGLKSLFFYKIGVGILRLAFLQNFWCFIYYM